MTAIIVRELFIDIRSMFRGWKLAFSIAFIGYVLIMILADGVEEIRFIMMMYCIWGTILMRHKVNRLYFLLPTGKMDRRNYLILKSFAVFLYQVLIYLSVVLVLSLHQFYLFSQEISVMFFYVIPALLSYSSINVGTYYYWETCKDKNVAKKRKIRYVFSMIISVALMINAYIPLTFHPKEYLQGIWLTSVTLLAYFLALICLLLQISILWNTEISEENVRKVEKLF